MTRRLRFEHDDQGVLTWVEEEDANGGSSPVLMASLTLDDAGIRAWSTTPAILVPATTVINYDAAITPDVVFFPIAATVITKIVAGYAVAGTSPEVLLAYSSDYANDASCRAGLTGLFQDGSWQTDLPCPQSFASTDVGTRVKGIGAQPINGDWLDNALVLASRDAVITGGDPANTLTATVLYVPVAT